MSRLAIKFAYLGDGFSGSQVQPDRRTVEGEIRRAASVVLKTDPDTVPLSISSRTDKGVNALGNVLVLDTAFSDPEALLRALNSVADGVFFLSYARVGDDFNPRHASRRVYRYVLPSDGLDMDLARECASEFVGEHNFAMFCRPDGKSTVVTVDSIDVDGSDGCIILTYTARFFLWNMVRRTASAICEVAAGRRCVDDVRAALAGERINFGISRADALTLMDVQYNGIDFVRSSSKVLSEQVDGMLFSQNLRTDFLHTLKLLD